MTLTFADELHDNGVHVRCQPPRHRVIGGNGDATNCRLAEHVEQYHSHDWDGPLICGCDDVSSGSD